MHVNAHKFARKTPSKIARLKISKMSKMWFWQKAPRVNGLESLKCCPMEYDTLALWGQPL